VQSRDFLHSANLKDEHVGHPFSRISAILGTFVLNLCPYGRKSGIVDKKLRIDNSTGSSINNLQRLEYPVLGVMVELFPFDSGLSLRFAAWCSVLLPPRKEFV
jgi:hypothetical protein